MSDVKRLIATFERNHWLMKAQTDGLTHADSLLPLPFRGNCMNWVLGHLAVYREKVLEVLGEGGVLSPVEVALYQRGSEPLTEKDPAVPLDQLLEKLDLLQARLAAGLERVTPEKLAEIRHQQRQQTVLDWLDFELWHETYHVGQLEYLRQLAGRNDSIID